MVMKPRLRETLLNFAITSRARSWRQAASAIISDKFAAVLRIHVGTALSLTGLKASFNRNSDFVPPRPKPEPQFIRISD